MLRDETIELSYYPEDDSGKKRFDQQRTLRLRKVCYQDEKDRYYEFLTNNFDIEAEEVAFLYKKRWGIEILFKKMKKNFQLHYFYGENENAIRTQVWCTLIAQLLLTVVQKIAQTKKAFSVVASLVRIHLISMLDVFEMLRSTRREYGNQQNRLNEPSPGGCLYDYEFDGIAKYSLWWSSKGKIGNKENRRIGNAELQRSQARIPHSLSRNVLYHPHLKRAFR